MKKEPLTMTIKIKLTGFVLSFVRVVFCVQPFSAKQAVNIWNKNKIDAELPIYLKCCPLTPY